MKTEKALHNYFRKTARRSGIDFYKLNCEGQTGFPDVMLAYKGHTVFIELKTPAGTGRLSPRQKFMIDKMVKQGLEVYVIDSKEEADETITDLIGRRPA